MICSYFEEKSESMHTPKQFTRNADGFYLQVELNGQAINFLLASNNEDQFYQLRLTSSPPSIRHMLPTLNHFYLYLLKNHNHPRAFKIDLLARIQVTVPSQHEPPITIILPANRITRDSIIPEDFVIHEEQSQVEEIKKNAKPHSDSGSVASYFGKKKNRKDGNSYCMDLEETPRSQSVFQSGSNNTAESIRNRDRQICQEAERMLHQGLQMRDVKHRLRLSDRTALKMYQQFSKFRRIFTPQQTLLLRRSKASRITISSTIQQNPGASAQQIRLILQQRGVARSSCYIQKWMSQNEQRQIYYEDSGSRGVAQ